MTTGYGSYRVHVGDCREVMATLPAGRFHCVVTSPPYFGLRDYGVDGQIGLEPTPDDFVQAMRAVFGGKDNPVGVWRVLRDDGCLFLNLGDSYNAYNGNRGPTGSTLEGRRQHVVGRPDLPTGSGLTTTTLKPKDLIGIPWRVAFALQADGWYLRQDIIWHKRSPMPESVQDRCTKAHEYVFLLTKSPRYFYDAVAVAEESIYQPGDREDKPRGSFDGKNDQDDSATNGSFRAIRQTRNRRSVWTMSSEPFSEAHFATFPRELPMTCIKAGTSERGCCAECGASWVRVTERAKRKRERPNDYTKRDGADGTGNSCANSVAGVTVTTRGWEPSCKCGAAVEPCRVFDPFNGAGTTGVAACTLGRDYEGAELNPEYAAMAERRIERELRPSTFRDESKPDDAPLFADAG